MQIVVNHLTRMQAGDICLAGIDVETGRHVRPVLRGLNLRPHLLRRNRGPFDLAALVDLGRVTPHPEPPEVEDHFFNPAQARYRRTLDPAEFWQLLTAQAHTKLADIFGKDLTQTGLTSATVPVGGGRASLGCLAEAQVHDLYIASRPGRRDQIRLCLGDGDFDLDLSVTDLRLYGADQQTPDSDAVQRIAGLLRASAPADILLSVGLTRPFTSDPSLPRRHWLQVNNIHLKQQPIWLLG